MCEIEHFVDPSDKRHPKFDKLANVELQLFSADNQLAGKSSELITIGVAVKRGMVNNETLGYFMARTHLFLINIGVDSKRLRFRQHMSNEMAHYATVCSFVNSKLIVVVVVICVGLLGCGMFDFVRLD